MNRATDIRTVIKALSEYDHSTNDEMGDTYCEFCDGYGPARRNPPRPMDHEKKCPVLAARRLQRRIEMNEEVMDFYCTAGHQPRESHTATCVQFDTPEEIEERRQITEAMWPLQAAAMAAQDLETETTDE